MKIYVVGTLLMRTYNICFLPISIFVCLKKKTTKSIFPGAMLLTCRRCLTSETEMTLAIAFHFAKVGVKMVSRYPFSALEQHIAFETV